MGEYARKFGHCTCRAAAMAGRKYPFYPEPAGPLRCRDALSGHLAGLNRPTFHTAAVTESIQTFRPTS